MISITIPNAFIYWVLILIVIKIIEDIIRIRIWILKRRIEQLRKNELNGEPMVCPKCSEPLNIKITFKIEKRNP